MKKILFLMIFIACYHSSFAYLSHGNWRWRNNDGTEETATWKAGQDTAIVINDNAAIRLRIDVVNQQSSTKGYGGGLEYSTTLKGPWLPISTATVDKNAFVLGGDNLYITDNQPTTPQLTESIAGTFAFGRMLTMSTDHSDSLLVKQRKEYEWCLKPTAFIAPNTTYYFRASIGGNPTTNIPSLTTGSNFASQVAILTNGGFEQGLTGWTNTTTDNRNNFALEDTAVTQGNTALRSIIVAPGTLGTTATIHTPYATVPGRLYLVRFDARADLNNAQLKLVIGSTATTQISYKTVKGWQLYQYAFRATSTSTPLSFYYQNATNYFIDNVTVQDDQDPVDDVPMTYMWQNNNKGYGWLTADGQESVPLPDGRVAWFFSDTWLGHNDTTNNYTNTNQLVNNPMVIQDGAPPNGALTTYFTGTSSKPTAFMIPPTPVGAQYWYWPRDAVVENNTIKILLPEVDRPTTNADPVNSGYQAIGTISLPDLKLLSIENMPFLTGDQLYYNVILKGDTTSQYSYVYGDGGHGSTVARYPKNQLSINVPWQFYTASGTWVTDYTKAAPVSQYGFGAMVQLGPNNYCAIFEPNVSNSIECVYAQNPLGPWVNHTVLYIVPSPLNGLTYFPYLHKETGKNGVYTISYSDNISIGQMLTDKGTYQPHYFKANLLALSPFTVKKSGDSITSVKFATANTQAILYFNTANKNDTGFQIQNSTDGATWKTVTSVAGGNSTTHATKFALPSNGTNYYRILLYDVDKKLTISPSAKFNVVESATVSNFTALAGNKQTNFTINTTQERFNHNFYIARSADGTTNWQQILTIPGSGITNSPQVYTANDKSPLPGQNYYRLVYYLNGKLNYSSVKMVDFTGDGITLNAFPNPASSNISFALKGYSGKSFTVTVTSLYGKPIGKETFNISPDETYTLKTRPTTGTYILNVEGESLSKVSRVLVQ